MGDLTQSHINVSHFDTLVKRIDEAANFYGAQGKNIRNVFFIPIVKGDKRPDVPKVYETKEDGNDTVARGSRLRPDEARRRVKNGGNVGIVVIIEKDIYSIVFFDFDVKNGKTLAPEEKIIEFIKSKNLFAYRSRNGGYRAVAVNRGNFDNAKIAYGGAATPGTSVDAGDILAWKKYTVAPGSFMSPDVNATPDATGYYEIFNDAPIRILENKDLPDWFEFKEELTVGQKTAIKTLKIDLTSDPNDNKHWKASTGLIVDDVRGMNGELDDFLEGASHTGRFEDRSATDFYVISQLLYYGFDEQQVAEILRYYRPYEKTMRADYLARSIAKLAGTDRDRYKTPEERAKEPLIILENVNVIEVDRLPDPKDLPLDKLIVLIIGPPRAGKSRWGLTVIADRGGGIYVAPNHTIIEQQFNTMTKIAPHLSSVWLAGKDKCCTQANEEGIRMDCMNCKLRPERVFRADEDYSGQLTTKNYEDDARKALRQLMHLNHDNIAEEFSYVCPYYLLHYAEKVADVCFTVPQFVASDDELTHVTPRAVMVLDEDTTFKYFVPSSVELFEFSKFMKSYGSGITAISHVPEILSTLEPLKDYITEKKRKPVWDKVILEIIEAYFNLGVLFDEFIESPMSGAATVAVAKENLITRARNVEMTFMRDTDRETKDLVLKKLQEYERDLHIRGENGLLPIFEPMLFPYKDSTLVWNGDNPSKMFLIGDQTQIIRRPCDANQYIIIGFTEAELFVKTFVNDLMVRSPHLHAAAARARELMTRPENDLWKIAREHIELVEQRRIIPKMKPRKEAPPPRITLSRDFQADLDFSNVYESIVADYRLKTFPFTENYTIFRIVGTIREQDRILFSLLRLVIESNLGGEWAFPSLVLTSSKDSQDRLWAALGESGETHECRIEKIERIRNTSMVGVMNTFYQNSTISRGVDVPQYDVMFVHSTAFAQPYWSARFDYYHTRMVALASALGRKSAKDLNTQQVSYASEYKSKMSEEELENEFRNAREEKFKTERIQTSLLSDETTNGALRMSPIPGARSQHRKLLILKDHDFRLINPSITKDMKVINIGNATDLNLVVDVCSKISKTTNPNAIFSVFDVPDPRSDQTMAKYCTMVDAETIIKYVSDGKFVRDDVPELKILDTSAPDLKPIDEQKIEDIMDLVYRNVLVFSGKWLEESKVIKNAKKQRKYMQTADITASLRKLVLAGAVLVEEQDGKTRYKATGKTFEKLVAPVAAEKQKISVKISSDPEW